ncbi:hypothetical protein E5676_scaffold190G00300 [Cucumis melo var. makuwa]|uniref:Uncharacterized protein n=1 Tax=Cucumis melo var. makuwa TaxID=1194695 RepID=A0A5D3DQT7_CUCMM|nr:hypothetical protein E6C27_scaffold1164G00080 [Cucumis melo var. makuwa]TYK25934.1 hypothetical protein E5676_scaffold190G00300 [Cucumis melo var. makuwa]
MPGFLAAPTREFIWKRFFQGVTTIRLEVVKMFYKGYINEEEHYAMACSALQHVPQVEVKDGVWAATLHRIITVDKNKAILKCLKTKQDDPYVFIGDSFNEKEEDSVGSPILSSTRKRVVDEEVNDPLQREQEINLEVDSETCLLSLPKSTPEASIYNPVPKQLVKDVLAKTKKVKRFRVEDGQHKLPQVSHNIVRPLTHFDPTVGAKGNQQPPSPPDEPHQPPLPPEL